MKKKYAILLLLTCLFAVPTVANSPLNEVHFSLFSNSKEDIEGLKIYPNPAKDVINITTSNFDPKTVVIYDVLGKQVLKTVITSQPINISNLKSGVYIVNITENNQNATRKLVIK